mgnify:FL=1
MKNKLTHKREREKSLRTIDAHNEIHSINEELKAYYGADYYGFYRSYICEKIFERLPKNRKYNLKYIAEILNHTKFEPI